MGAYVCGCGGKAERLVIDPLPGLDLKIIDSVRQHRRVSVAEESRVSKIRTEASCRGYITRRSLWNASACGEPASTLTGSIFASNAKPCLVLWYWPLVFVSLEAFSKEGTRSSFRIASICCSSPGSALRRKP